jgi:ribonuclease BN (tRNA processing enzyme)
MDFIVFLGTGGGRYVTSSQARATGGIYFSLNGINFIIDPGPGSLVHLRELKLNDPSGILLSHCHIDHSSDASALIDLMKEPFFIAEKHCITGDDSNWPCLSKYHMAKVAFSKPMEAGDSVKIPGSNIGITATEAHHTSPSIGFVIETGKRIGYVGDSTGFRGIQKPFENCDILIFNVLVPYEKNPLENKHMGLANAIDFINAMERKPKLILLQHFSFWMLQNNVNHQAKILEEKTGVKTIAARDFMKFDLNNLKEISENENKNSGLDDFS